MASTTRSRPKEIISVHDSDSESDSDRFSAPRGDFKRQKTEQTMDEDIIMMDAPPTPPASVRGVAKNAHLKGRKRFMADFEDLKKDGVECAGFAVIKIRAGDDDGMMNLVVVDRTKDDSRVVRLNLVVPDPSDYPKNHTYLPFTDDTVPARVQRAFEGLAQDPVLPLTEALERMLRQLGEPEGGAKGKKPVQITNVSSDEEGSDDDGYDPMFFDEDDFVSTKESDARAAAVLAVVQRDFLEIVSSSYRPGLIPLTPVPSLPGGFDPAADFIISISLPTVSLTDTIPAQALVAWDRALLGSPRARHLVLLVSGFGGTGYPALTRKGELARTGGKLRFQVGVCGQSKPAHAHAVETVRTYGLVTKDADDEVREAQERAAKEREMAPWDPDADNAEHDASGAAVEPEPQEKEDLGRFERFSLSSSLETLLDAQLLKLVWIRCTFNIGWAGAEVMQCEVERDQKAYTEVWDLHASRIIAADKDEAKLARTGVLPHDPLRTLGPDDEINVPYTAFCYLVRRLTLCTRYCIVCHEKLTAEFEALKPYVCDSKLCAYQYYTLNRGPSLEYEIIHNPQTVDLLVSLAFSAAAEGVIDDPLPIGMGIRVPLPDASRIVTPPTTNYGLYQNAHGAATPAPAAAAVPVPKKGLDGLVEFDELSVPLMRVSIVMMIDSLPSIDDMKRHLERKVKPGKSKPRLKDMENGTVLPAAWSILRWCVASCTAYLEEMSSSEEQCIQGLDPTWRQFRFSVGAPDAEAKFQAAIKEAQQVDKNANQFPHLYAFHGSALRNWHSIIRHGLWYKTVANGRAFGDGVYLAKEATTSMGHYAQGGRSSWRKSKLGPTSCVALAQIVNLPSKFVSHNPHFVVKDTHWIMCRYLLVKSMEALPDGSRSVGKAKKTKTSIPFVVLDPAHQITLQSKRLEVPTPGYMIDALVELRKNEAVDEDHDEMDEHIFSYIAEVPAPTANSNSAYKTPIVLSDDDDEAMPALSKGKGKARALVSTASAILKGKGGSSSKAPKKGPPKDDWQHNEAYVLRAIERLMPPPFESTPSSTHAVQRELKAMLKEQAEAMVSEAGLKGLGWYMSEDLMGDNLFQWILELHSFDETLPIAKDLKAKGVNSLIFEIRFPPTYPIGPPFFRIITPRFLPFIHGGGGHVTGGGSICMDLLTSNGWLPSYSISAVLLQIRLAISNLDPRPARLALNWDSPYAVSEALVGFKRAAATHGWTVPDGLDKLVR